MRNLTKHTKRVILLILLLGPLPLFAQLTNQSTFECDEVVLYTVKESDTIKSIATYFGSDQFEEILYSFNSDRINDKNSLKTGTELKIPINIAQYRRSKLSLDEVLNNPSCPSGTKDSVVDNQEMNEDEIMRKFREAFEALSNAEQDTVPTEEHVKAEQQILTGIDGMVIDETRSKVGRDFYDVFYQYWQAPENASRFTITISEQPAPGLGTVILVKANDTETFRYRLQPRYDIIQEAGRYAVRVTHNHLQNNPQDFVIY